MTPQTLILLPGLLCSEELWHPQIEALQNSVDCTVPDLTHSDSITGMAQHVLKQAPERFSLAGLSMGGTLAFEIMRLAPERVIRLALLDCTPLADTPERSKSRKKQLAMANSGKFLEVTTAVLMPLLIHPDYRNNIELRETIIRMAMKVGLAGFRNQIQALMHKRNSRPMLSQITCPTLVLCGREDKLTPLALHEEMAQVIPNAYLVIVDHCGHLSTLEQPDIVTAALKEWLFA